MLEDIFSLEFRIVGNVFHLETGLPAHVLHTVILSENIRREACKAFVAANLDETLQKFSAKPQPLPLITDEQRKLSFISPASLA